jgi:tRNA/tmRNA/rRNA uracil-C5-methylase (TrmA/RlmC/RlmD family)
MPKPPRKFRAEPYPYHHKLELEIGSLTNLGHGVGRDDGWVVLVPFALPGELVRVRIHRNHKNYSEADLIEVLRPSPDRVEAPCEVFGQCGGCQYQQLVYGAQLLWKRQQVEELLVRMAGIEHEVEETVASPKVYGYRSKITPHYHRPKGGEVGAVGFLRAGTRGSLVDVGECVIASPAINERLAEARREVRENEGGRKRGATLLLREDGYGRVVSDPKEEIEEEVDGVRFRFLAGDFFQNNPSLLPAFTRHVREEAAAGGARHLIDAYCGAGLFALTAAREFETVVGIEISETAVERARGNALANGIGHARFEVGSAEDIFGRAGMDGGETAVIIDPPRRGCEGEFLEQLFRFRPRTIVYVSCNPATQMRDLSALVAAGYRVSRVRPFDLFPQTRHLECVVTAG